MLFFKDFTYEGRVYTLNCTQTNKLRFCGYVQRHPYEKLEQFMVHSQERRIVRYELKIRTPDEGDSEVIIYDLEISREGFPATPVAELMHELWIAYKTQRLKM